MDKTNALKIPSTVTATSDFDPTPQDDLLRVLRDLAETADSFIKTSEKPELAMRLARLRRDARAALKRYDGSAE